MSRCHCCKCGKDVIYGSITCYFVCRDPLVVRNGIQEGDLNRTIFNGSEEGEISAGNYIVVSRSSIANWNLSLAREPGCELEYTTTFSTDVPTTTRLSTVEVKFFWLIMNYMISVL